MFVGPSRAADEVELWTLRPYAVHVVIAADTDNALPSSVAEGVADHLRKRAAAVVGPVWKLTVTAADAADRLAIRNAIEQRDIKRLAPLPAPTEPDDEAAAQAFEPALATGFDKLMLVRIDEGVSGVNVSAVEYDNYLQRLGPTRGSMVATLAAVDEAVFRSVCDVFSPVALFAIDRDNYRQASLAFRGSELPAPASAPRWSRSGDVFQPVLRQTNREGVVPEGGVREVAWTLLEMTDDDPAAAKATVVSHTRRPFGARRRGRIEQLAVRLPRASDATRLRLHAREDAERPLAGYHVYARDTADGELLPLGATDERGTVVVPRGDAAIRTLYVKSGSKLVAKLPIAPGTAEQLDAPLVDESKRIDAEARLTLLREELIDLVARRTILVSRTRAAIESKEFDKARGFVAQLESLPGLNLFNQRLTDQEQLSRARNPAVQARIDKLFEQTRAVLSAFLGSREITELRRSVDEAARKAAG